MNSLLFIKKNYKNNQNDEVTKLISDFKTASFESLRILENETDIEKIRIEKHKLRGIFDNKKLYKLLQTNQTPENMKKNINKIRKIINNELKKLDD